jgi:hypothetical protein
MQTPTALPAAGTSPQWGEAGRGSSEAERQVEGLFEGLLSEAFAYNAPTFLPHRPCREQRHGEEFGGGEYDVGMNILIYTQLDIVSPPFSSRSSLRGANGGAWRGQNATLSKK